MAEIITPSPGQLARAFGLSSVAILGGFRPSPYVFADALPDDPSLYLSSLGTPVMTDLTLDQIRYQDTDGSIKVVPSITMQTVLISVSVPKNIVETAIQGHDGTIPEYIGKGDYQITINGIIVGGNGRYPKDEVAALNHMVDAPRPIPVVSWYLQNIGIYDIIIKDFSVAQEAGTYSQQPFTLTCRSYFPTIIQIS